MWLTTIMKSITVIFLSPSTSNFATQPALAGVSSQCGVIIATSSTPTIPLPLQSYDCVQLKMHGLVPFWYSWILV